MKLRFLLLSAVLCLLATSALAAPPSMSRDDIICMAKSGLGFSYWWGNGGWCANGCSPNLSTCSSGVCTPKPGYSGCPNCNHSGSYGADCSGYAARCWKVPSEKAISSNWHPYSTFHFYWNSTHWDHISKSDAKKGDTLVYRKLTSTGQDCSSSSSCSGGGHIVVYESGDAWGWSNVNHAKGCVHKIKYENKSMSSNYKARRRHNLIEGVCNPGQTQSQPCGNCGTQIRTCNSGAQWGGWGGCQGQGECAPDSSQEESCGDCGQRQRSCKGDCSWQSWSDCWGPDPEDGNQVCDSTMPGVCAEGRMRCHEGWLGCINLLEPSPELCDDLDNDCDGVWDEDEPLALGVVAPLYGAELVDFSFPHMLPAGQQTTVWADFRNVGLAPWKDGEVWLCTEDKAEGASRLYLPGAWPAWDTPAVLEWDVAPGQIARLQFPVRPDGAPGDVIEETFHLRDPGGDPLRCPAPALHVKFKLGPAADEPAPTQTGAEDQLEGATSTAIFPLGPGESPPEAGGCGMGPANSPAWLLLLLSMAWAVRRRLRRYRLRAQ